MKRWAPLIACLLLAGAAYAVDVFKVWTDGETLTAADLNADFTHIHNLMVGGGHNTLTNGDVAANANISDAKFAGGSTIWPVGSASYVDIASCSGVGSFCTITSLTGFSSVNIQHGVTGDYTVSFSPSLTDLNYAILLSTNTLPVSACHALINSTNSFFVTCQGYVLTTAPADMPFSFFIMDDN